FFFSSRRRHTRFSRDWSSDVCSSDLTSWKRESSSPTTSTPRACSCTTSCRPPPRRTSSSAPSGHGRTLLRPRRWPEMAWTRDERSEERRVGKGCRARGTPHEEQEKGG